MRRISLFMFLMFLTSCLFATPIVYEFAVKKTSSFWQWVGQKCKEGVFPSYSEKLQEPCSHKSLQPPAVIENSIMKMHFNHSEGYIDSLWYKNGSGEQLVDQFWNDREAFGLGKIQHETGTTVTSYFVGSDSAMFEYQNSMYYDTKRFDIKWSATIGIEIKFTFNITAADTFQEGGFWEPGGNNSDFDDSIRIFTAAGDTVNKRIHYPGVYQGLWSGTARGIGIWDADYDEVFGYRYPSLYIRTGTEASMDGPFVRLKGPAGVEEEDSENGKGISLFPNPFIEVTTIQFQVVSPGRVQLQIYSISGRLVKILIDKEVKAGYYTADWDAQGFPAGIYFAKFKAGEYKETKKLILVR